jgi:hypothetical protein
MLIIPLQATASQVVTVTLTNQPCRIEVAQKSTGLFINLYVSDVLIIGGVICLNGVPIVRDAYLGFTGDLAFFDNQGTTDPVYTGLGDRYSLVYIAPGDIA